MILLLNFDFFSYYYFHSLSICYIHFGVIQYIFNVFKAQFHNSIPRETLSHTIRNKFCFNAGLL